MTYDVIVIGGGAAGVGAAIGAAQAGATTLLVESGPCLGGAATQKNVLTYCGLYTQSDPPRLAVGGVALQVMRELSGLGGAIGPVRLDSPGITLSRQLIQKQSNWRSIEPWDGYLLRC